MMRTDEKVLPVLMNCRSAAEPAQGIQCQRTEGTADRTGQNGQQKLHIPRYTQYPASGSTISAGTNSNDKAIMIPAYDKSLKKSINSVIHSVMLFSPFSNKKPPI